MLASLLQLASLLASTVAGSPAVAGLPSAVYVCDVSIVSAAVHRTVASVLVVSSTAANVPDVAGVSAASGWLLHCCLLSH
jgi:hypothetical protein